MISSWHAHIAKQKLREEGEIEDEKNQNSVRTSPHFIVHASEQLRPPEMNRSQECRNRAADHDVMEMRDDEIGVMDMHVYGQQREHQARQSAHHEQADETHGEKEGGVKGDRALIQGGRPVIDLDR